MSAPASPAMPIGVQKAPPVYIMFSFFGAGSAWMTLGALYLEIAVFQEKLGLLVANRCALGYQTGALWVPIFMASRWLLQHCGRSVDYRLLIPGLSVVQLLNLSFASLASQSLESLLVIAHVAGASGYLSGVVHQAYLAMHCQDVYSPAFWAGDAAAGGLAALVVAIQQPELGPEGRLFGPRVVFMSLIPVVLLSLVAFLCIDRFRLGFLPSSLSPVDATTVPEVPVTQGIQGVEGIEGSEADAELPHPHPQPSRWQQAGQGQGQGQGQGFELLRQVAQEAPPGSSPPLHIGHTDDTEPLEAEQGGTAGDPNAKTVRHTDHIEPLETEQGGTAAGDPNAPLLQGKRPPPPAGGTGAGTGTGTGTGTGVSRCLGLGLSLLPAAGRAQPGLTSALLFIGFWASLTCWGIGDSLIPYACAGSSPADKGEDCVFHSSIATVVAVLLGSNCAGIAARPRLADLWPTTLIYSIAFGLLCLAAARGGRWARPWVGPSEFVSGGDGEPNGGSYVVVLVLLIRALQPYMAVTRQRIIQLDFAEEDREVMNLFIYAFTTAANIAGVAVVTWMLS